MKFESMYAGRTVAVTGASGYIAGELIDELSGQNCRVLRVSRQALTSRSGIDADIIGDIAEPEIWLSIVERADVIFHLAGNTSVYGAEKDPLLSLRSIVIPIVHLIAAAKKMDKRIRVVLAGTATQFGLTECLPVNETARDHPITVHDLHKLFAEKELLLATQTDWIAGTCLRLANVYGPSAGRYSSSERGVLNKVVQAALAGNHIQVFGDGQQIRDYTYLSDAVEAFLATGSNDRTVGRYFVVGTGRGVTVADAFAAAARIADRATGRTTVIRKVPWPNGLSKIETRSFIADASAFSAATGWRPRIGLEEGIERTVEALLGNPWQMRS
jgi:nucleoside-diphosphate-sugar epimerase